MGPGGQGTPHVIDSEQSSGAAGHCAAVAHRRRASPAVTSSQCDPRDLTRRLVYLAGPIVDASDDGGGHGGAEVRVDGEMPVELR